MIARLLCFSLAAASAYNIPTTRRAVLAKVAAVAPLAAVFPAFAELRYNTRGLNSLPVPPRQART